MIKYRTKFHGSAMAHIDAREVLRETAKQVVLRPPQSDMRDDREAKVSDYQNWFDTWEQAHDFLISQALSRVEMYKRRLAEAEATLLMAEKMTDDQLGTKG